MTRDLIVEIGSRDYWFTIVEFLQQNWALAGHTNERFVVWFINDTSGVFDELIFSKNADAVSALQRNAFRRYADESTAPDFIAVPTPPFYQQEHPNGPTYLSGRL